MLTTEVRITLDCLKTLTYNCGEEHYATLQKLNNDLQKITATLRKQLPESEGLVVRPQKKLKHLVRMKRSVAVKLQLSQIPCLLLGCMHAPKKQAGRFSIQKQTWKESCIPMMLFLQMATSSLHLEPCIKEPNPHSLGTSTISKVT